LKADIQTVEAQLVKASSSQAVIKETLLSVKAILETISDEAVEVL
jgi:hypothetical protein